MPIDQTKYEESKLLALLAQDSEYAFQLIYDQHRNRIYKTAIKYLKSPIIAQDVVQDVFLKLWFERKNIKPNQPIEAWLYTVGKNNIINRLKKLGNEWKAMTILPQLAPPSPNTTQHTVEDRENTVMLNEAVAAMSKQQRLVFELARKEQLTYVEIGEKLALSPLTVKTHMARALQHIKLFLKKRGALLF
jgi:RNA polymerase sigma-70 factor (ECF subfamily)